MRLLKITYLGGHATLEGFPMLPGQEIWDEKLDREEDMIVIDLGKEVDVTKEQEEWLMENEEVTGWYTMTWP